MTSAKQQLKDLQQVLKLLSIRGHLRGADRQTIDEVLGALRQQAGETISKSNAAELLDVSRQSLDRWIKAGMLPAVKASNGRQKIPRQALEQIIARVNQLRDSGQQRALLAQALKDLAGEIDPESKKRDGAKKKAGKKIPSANSARAQKKSSNKSAANKSTAARTRKKKPATASSNKPRKSAPKQTPRASKSAAKRRSAAPRPKSAKATKKSASSK
jgi:excisionase family DNA binding protein